jgi:hypothetical protein
MFGVPRPVGASQPAPAWYYLLSFPVTELAVFCENFVSLWKHEGMSVYLPIGRKGLLFCC